MVIRELAARLGLDIDFAAFAKAGGAIEVLRLGLDKVVEGAVEVVTQFVENVKSALEYGDELHDTSQAMGVATGALQELRYAASLSNLSTEELDLSIKFLSRNMREAAQGTGEAGKAFARLGVHVKDANGKLRSADDVIGDLAEKIAALPDGTEKTALAMQFFGRSGQRLIPLLNEGRDGLAAMRKEARDLGLVMGKDSVDAADELGDNLRRLKAVGEGLWRGAIAPLLPAISDLVKQFLAWRKANAEILRQRLQSVIGALVTTVKVFGAVLKSFTENWKVYAVLLVAGFIAVEGAAVAAAIASAAAWLLAAAPVVAVVAAIGLLYVAIDDLIGFMEGKDSLVGEWIDQAFGEGESTKLVEELKENWEAVVEAIHEAYDWLVQYGVKLEKIIKIVSYSPLGLAVRGSVATSAWLRKKAGIGGGESEGGEFGPNPERGGVVGDLLQRARGRKQRDAEAGRAANEAGLRAEGLFGPENAPSGWRTAPMAGGSGGGTQVSNTFHITQLPGEDGESFAQRVASIVDEKRSTEYESSAAALASTY